MADKSDKDATIIDPQDSLLDALESIKSLLAKSDAKLSAARESIAIASNQTEKNSLHHDNEQEQLEIPVLDDIVIPGEEAAHIVETINETLAVASQSIAQDTISTEQEPAQIDTQIIEDYLAQLQKNLEKSLRDSLMKSIVTIESGLKKTLNEEITKIRQQIQRDFE